MCASYCVHFYKLQINFWRMILAIQNILNDSHRAFPPFRAMDLRAVIAGYTFGKLGSCQLFMFYLEVEIGFLLKKICSSSRRNKHTDFFGWEILLYCSYGWYLVTVAW